jgi:glycosyltransferase involved in cell wall biosynthesis
MEPRVRSGVAERRQAGTWEEIPQEVGAERIGLIWAGAYYTPGGYGDEARGFIGALCRCGFPLRIIPLICRDDSFLTPEQRGWLAALERVPVAPGQAAVVHHYPPYQVVESFWGRVNIVRTMFETDRIPGAWLEQLRRVNEVWVPARFNLETFASSGVPHHKLRVVHAGVDTTLFHPGAPPLDVGTKKGFTFLSVFNWSERPGWDLLLTAYCTEFKPEEDVALLIKTYKFQNTHGTIDEQYHAFINRFAPPRQALPEVRFIKGVIPGHLLPGLYTACDAYVLPSHGEGWGRPYMEAMACGLPVIGTKWGGNLEFMNEENSYLIEIEGLEDVPDNAETFFYKGYRWSRPSVDHLRQLMRHVYEHRQEARSKGAKARADVCRHWTWDHATAAVMKELAKFNLGTAPVNSAKHRKTLTELNTLVTPLRRWEWENNVNLRGTRMAPLLGPVLASYRSSHNR